MTMITEMLMFIERIEKVETLEKKRDIKESSQSDFQVNIRIYHGDDMDEFEGDFEETINLY